MPICSRAAAMRHRCRSQLCFQKNQGVLLFRYFVELNVTFRRVTVFSAKDIQWKVEWLAVTFKRYTERLREHVEHRTLEETVAYAAQETNLSWDTVKEIDARLRRLYEHFHWDNSRRLAVDEFAIHRGHRYATVVYSIDTKKVLWLDRGRSRATLRKFFNLLTPEQKAGIRAVAMDQNSAFDLEVKENCPNGVVVYDLFHVLSNFGRKVIDRVRVDAANSLRHAPWLRKVVKSSRYLLYKRHENLSRRSIKTGGAGNLIRRCSNAISWETSFDISGVWEHADKQLLWLWTGFTEPLTAGSSPGNFEPQGLCAGHHWPGGL